MSDFFDEIFDDTEFRSRHRGFAGCTRMAPLSALGLIDVGVIDPDRQASAEAVLLRGDIYSPSIVIVLPNAPPPLLGRGDSQGVFAHRLAAARALGPSVVPYISVRLYFPIFREDIWRYQIGWMYPQYLQASA